MPIDRSALAAGGIGEPISRRARQQRAGVAL